MTAPKTRDEELIVVFCTVPDAAQGRALGRMLVERRLAACVNVIDGLTSIYRWQDAIHEDPESLLVIKTRRAAFAELAEALVAAHPYQVPEVVALPAAAVHVPYLHWALEQTRPSTPEQGS
ncbi:MAG: divalent-cation tolerance protein CutA [Acidobacteriota bacterium]|nr:divalent-cation tolerance protein CutA [Acidobacteriota bacterium]MDQ7088637.1 divalent-cation tolerance protein CutA [Acidobacteriota bacterium]